LLHEDSWLFGSGPENEPSAAELSDDD
jgi:hypothetical protein